jgi:hypothetical protein
VIDNIQVELVEPIQPMVLIVDPNQTIVIIIESSQPIQHVAKPIYVENPQFFITQHVPISCHSIKNLRQISMF